ncbi:MAG TPA: hypothetical protein VGM43_06020 [Bryobacteraceae bacterium]|jgi:hypothetical protein
MIPAWRSRILLRIASLLAPSHHRAEWLEEWTSELWYIPQSQATAFCLGAFQDALWLRRNRPVFEKRPGIHLDSPLTCLAVLTALAASGLFFAFQVISPRLTPSSPLKVPDLVRICLGVQLLSCVLLSALLCVWMPPARRYRVSLSSTLRRISFLVLKTLLLQSIVLCASLGLLFLKPLEGFTATIGGMGVVLALRWIITDQQNRCPICLRLLTNPVLIGSSSRTFLEWYGAESTCPHGHGLLLTPEIPSTWSRPQWIHFDDSWSDLFETRSRPTRA